MGYNKVIDSSLTGIYDKIIRFNEDFHISLLDDDAFLREDEILLYSKMLFKKDRVDHDKNYIIQNRVCFKDDYITCHECGIPIDNITKFINGFVYKYTNIRKHPHVFCNKCKDDNNDLFSFFEEHDVIQHSVDITIGELCTGSENDYISSINYYSGIIRRLIEIPIVESEDLHSLTLSEYNFFNNSLPYMDSYNVY